MQYPGFISNVPGAEGRYPVNLFFSPEEENSRVALVGTPGLTLRVTPKYGSVRGSIVYRDILYVVCADTLYSISTEWVATSRGTLSTTIGPVQVIGVSDYLSICDGTNFYYYDIAAGTTTTGDTATYITTQDGYTLKTVENSNLYLISALNNPTSWDDLDFGQTGGKDDFNRAIESVQRRVFIFSEQSREAVHNSGNADFPFERVQGSTQGHGIGSPASATVMDESIYYLDNHRRIVRTAGMSYQVVSTPEVNNLFQGYSDVSDAIGNTIKWKGHSWYVLTLPTEDTTWVYDAYSNHFFQWVSGAGENQHRAMTLTHWESQNKFIAGDYESGGVYTIEDSVFTDNGGTIIRERIPPALINDRKVIRVNRLEVEFKAGTGISSGQGSDPKAMLTFSLDDGRTWSNEIWRDIGKLGEFKDRAVWNRLGVGRFTWTPRVRISDPVEVVMYSASVEATGGVR